MGITIAIFMVSIAFISGLGVVEENNRRDYEIEMNKYKHHYRQSFIQPIPVPVMKPGTKYCQAPIFIDKNSKKLDYNTLSQVDREKGIIAALKCKNDNDNPCLRYLRKIKYNKHSYNCTKKIIFELPKGRK